MRFLPLIVLLLAPLPLLAMEAAPPAKPAAPAVAPAALPVHTLGNPEAKVTITEYASLACPHCAHFAKEMLPKLEEKYIATGKVKLVYRDFPLEGLSLHAAQLAQCMPEDRYFPFIKTLFNNQEGWLKSTDPEATLAQYGKLAGLSEERVKSCLADKSIETALVNQRLEAEQKYKVNATPTFIVNGGDKIEGAKTFDDFEKELLKYVK